MVLDIDDELTWLGASVLAAQRIEFGLYGIAAHAAHTTPAAKEKRFRALTPEDFLSGDPVKLKATLGQLVNVFGDQFLIRTAELDKYVDDRNLIYHNYWRLTRGNTRGGQTRLDSPIVFLREFVERSDRLNSIIKGFYAHLMTAAAKKEGRNFQITDDHRRDMDAYLKHVDTYLKEKM